MHAVACGRSLPQLLAILSPVCRNSRRDLDHIPHFPYSSREEILRGNVFVVVARNHHGSHRKLDEKERQNKERIEEL